MSSLGGHCFVSLEEGRAYLVLGHIFVVLSVIILPSCVSINAVIFSFSHYTSFICAGSLQIWMQFDWMGRGNS